MTNVRSNFWSSVLMEIEKYSFLKVHNELRPRDQEMHLPAGVPVLQIAIREATGGSHVQNEGVAPALHHNPRQIAPARVVDVEVGASNG